MILSLSDKEMVKSFVIRIFYIFNGNSCKFIMHIDITGAIFILRLIIRYTHTECNLYPYWILNLKRVAEASILIEGLSLISV